jgi:hypothetical protein
MHDLPAMYFWLVWHSAVMHTAATLEDLHKENIGSST